MGFKRTQTVYSLVFDEEFAGLVVKLRRGSIRERLEFERLDDWQERINHLAPFLIEWNITDDDDQVLPLTAESLWSLEEPTLIAILCAYTEAIYPPDPLEEPSNDGETLEVASIPTETLSESLAS